MVKGSKGNTKNNKGFSLIELMVAVAIIGILAAIAIPNYQTFQRRARQSEGKSLLSGIYTAQRSFNAEWGGGTTDLGASGFSPEGELSYVAGFGHQTQAHADCRSAGANPSKYSGTLALTERTTASAAVCPTTGLGGTILCQNSSGMSQNTTSGAVSDFLANKTGSTATALTGAQAQSYTASCNNSQFTAVAVSDLGGSQKDIWTMTHVKQLSELRSGI